MLSNIHWMRAARSGLFPFLNTSLCWPSKTCCAFGGNCGTLYVSDQSAVVESVMRNVVGVITVTVVVVSGTSVNVALTGVVVAEAARPLIAFITATCCFMVGNNCEIILSLKLSNVSPSIPCAAFNIEQRIERNNRQTLY